LIQAQTASGNVQYGVNALGQRVSKTGGGSTNRYVYDETGHLLGEYDGSGNRIQEHLWLGDLPVAVVDANGDLFPVLSDHLNTPRQIIDANNLLRWRWDNSDPFGNNAPEQNPQELGNFTYNLRFPGQYFDQETGLHYNYFRDYDPKDGRYTQSDPIGLAGGLNTYTYVSNNPLYYIDPTGESEAIVLGGAGLLAAGVLAVMYPDAAQKLLDGISDLAKSDTECNCTYYHYTDEDGYLGITNSNYTIKANPKGLVYVTTEQLSADQARSNLFMGGYGSYGGKGEYVIQFTMKCNTPLFPGTQPNELIHLGSLRLGRQIQNIIFAGLNPF